MLGWAKKWRGHRKFKKSFAPKGWHGYARIAWDLALVRRHWPGLFFREQRCVVCGRQFCVLFDFVRLVKIMGKVRSGIDGYEWYNEDYNLVDEASSPDDYLRFVCLDHRNLTGSPIWDIMNRLAVDVPIQRSRLYYILRNLGRGILIGGAVPVRFVWFLIYGWLEWNFFGPARFVLCTKSGA